MAGDIPQCMHCGAYMHVSDAGRPHQCAITPFYWRDNIMNKPEADTNVSPGGLQPPSATVGREMIETWFRWTQYPAPDKKAWIDAVEAQLAAMPTAGVDCPKCGGRGWLECDDPQCSDSTWDHDCTAGATCDKCGGKKKMPATPNAIRAAAEEVVEVWYKDHGAPVGSKEINETVAAIDALREALEGEKNS